MAPNCRGGYVREYSQFWIESSEVTLDQLVTIPQIAYITSSIKFRIDVFVNVFFESLSRNAFIGILDFQKHTKLAYYIVKNKNIYLVLTFISQSRREFFVY